MADTYRDDPLRETGAAFDIGDWVRWKDGRGQVVHFATQPGEMEGVRYAASDREPRYIVRVDGEGGLVARRADELRPAEP